MELDPRVRELDRYAVVEPESFESGLRRLRERAGLTQEQLAQRAGLSVNAVSTLERGERRYPYPHTVRALAAALDLDAEERDRLTAGIPPRQRPRPSTETPATLRPVTPEPPVPRHLPAVTRIFTGRASHLAELDALVSEMVDRPATGVVVINGTAGVGKTTLAVRWAHRIADRFPDGQLYVNLRGYDPGPRAEPQDVLDGFLRALNLPAADIPSTLEERAALFRSVVNGRRMLLILDNASSAEQVRPLLPGSVTCLVVVTSRDELTGLAVSVGAARLKVPLLPPGDAVSLLRDIIGADRAAAEPAAVAELAALCAHLPLALQLAGQRGAARPRARLADLVTELAPREDRLDMLSSGRDDYTAVRQVFSWSYRGLPERQARLFRLLGLHEGPDITAHAAAALVGESPGQARLLLDGLAEAHLVEHIRHDRFGFHDLLRAYARDRLDATVTPGDRQAALGRLVGFYLHTATTAGQLLHPGRRGGRVDGAAAPAYPLVLRSYREASQWCGAEHANVTATIRTAAGSGLDTAAWQIADGMWSFFYIGKHWTDWAAACDLGLTAARRTDDPDGQQRMLNGLAIVHRDLRRYEAAIGNLRCVLTLARQTGDQLSEAATLSNLGDVHLGQHRYEEALRYSTAALQVLGETDNQYMRGIALGNIAEAYLGLRRYGDALGRFEEVLDLCRQTGHRHGEATTLLHLGAAYLGLCRHRDALDHLTAALELCREIGDRHGEGRALRRLGAVYRATGRRRTAQEHRLAALTVFEGLGDPEADEVRTELCGSHRTARDVSG